MAVLSVAAEPLNQGKNARGLRTHRSGWWCGRACLRSIRQMCAVCSGWTVAGVSRGEDWQCNGEWRTAEGCWHAACVWFITSQRGNGRCVSLFLPPVLLHPPGRCVWSGQGGEKEGHLTFHPPGDSWKHFLSLSPLPLASTFASHSLPFA